MPLQATSGAASYDAFGGGVPVSVNYIEDVFSTYLYTGNGSTQTITNGIDLSGKGGLTWIKSRSAATDHFLFDTTRGALNEINSNTQDLETSLASSLTAFNNNGFSLGNAAGINVNEATYCSWTFREQSKFFDVVTYTGNGSSNRQIAHNLGSAPGMIIVKRLSPFGNAGIVYHRSLGGTKFLVLSEPDAASTSSSYWNNTDPTSTEFTVSNFINGSGQTWVAYLFAHDAGGFGLTGTDNVISCGSFTTDGSGNATVSLGYEPQWLMVKDTTNAQSWYIEDNMRAFNLTSRAILFPNLSNAEATGASAYLAPNSTGFAAVNGQLNASATYIYIAIRRGPMKVPTSGTSVFTPVVRAGTSSNITTTSIGFPPDLVMSNQRTSWAGGDTATFDRLRGANARLNTDTTSAESTVNTDTLTGFDAMTGIRLGIDLNSAVINYLEGTETYINWNFRRAPSFFDEVCYTGTGSAATFSHNLQAVPELIICKQRNSANSWFVYAAPLGASQGVALNGNFAAFATTGVSALWNETTPTSTVFSLGQNTSVNASAATYVAYLFASCAGVSKVGSYTGTGTTLQIDCGFTSGARFVLIRRTSASSSNWYVWDSARGIVSGNDPYLLLDTTAAEVTSTDYIDTYSAGFEISSTAPAAINASGGSFIFFAVS